MHFSELDATTRGWMLKRFETEEASVHGPYRSPVLNVAGLAAFPDLMRAAIVDPNGSEVTLEATLERADYWYETEVWTREGVERERKVNVKQASERLAITEFNTWYVAGLAHRLDAEGETNCVVYRASEPKFEHASCSQHEGQTVAVADVVVGHRVGYWPQPGVVGRFAIPAGPGCHHTIRRVS